ncbi:MAG: beta-lactamase family protein, partial [Clostridiales Family XIII bacterium]|nr:beta-lactamase family protein [Clostridiales Family XIII bacterium]
MYKKRSCVKPVILILLYAMLFSIMLSSAYAGDEQPLQVDQEKLTDYIKKAFAESKFNGYVIVSKDSETLFSGGHGTINSVSKITPDENTVFGIASITKPLTAIGIALLEQRGILTYTDTIDKYLDGVPEDKKAISLHQLLTHTSGITDGVADDTEFTEKQELLARISKSELLFVPGERFEYSNAGYSLLAAIIENAAGKTYADFMREDVFMPLGMTDTGFAGMEHFKNLNVTNGYYNGEDYGKLSEYPFSWNGLVGNGDVLSTPADMKNLFSNLFSYRL